MSVSPEGVAWFFMGEGSISLGVKQQPSNRVGYGVFPQVTISNTEKGLLIPIAMWLEQHGIPYSMWGKSEQRNRRPVYTIGIFRWKAVIKFLGIVESFLIGRKKRVCEIILECYSKFQPHPKVGGNNRWNLSLRDSQKRFLEMMRYRDKIIELNGNNGNNHGRTKYSYEYFMKLFGWDVYFS